MSFIKEFQHLRISLQDLKSATNNFAETNCIGRGGFGKVYKGEILLSGVLTMVAIKRLDRSFGQGTIEFWKEIMMLSQYKHENLVSLLGFCDEGGENLLVYEYLSNRSLDLYLNSVDLSWLQRLIICLGAAMGLQYLHEPVDGSQQRVLHRDIKSANILLDHNWRPKIADFGLSKLGPANQQFTFLFSNAVGTVGYCDPLYAHTGFLTKESDVYSFGVVLFEVLCGRPCVLQKYDDIRRSLTALSRKCYEEKKMDTIIPIGIQDNISPKCLERFSAIAYQCLQLDRAERPTMGKVVEELRFALNYQVSKVKSKMNNNMDHESGPQTISSSSSFKVETQLYESTSASNTNGTGRTGSSGRRTNINKFDIHIGILDDVEISWEGLIVGEQIGQGSFGTVYHALWYGSDVAVKVFTNQEYTDDVILSFKKEVSLMKRLRHPNILLFMGAVTSPEHLYIVTEFLPRGNLFGLLQRNKAKLDWRRRINMAMDIARGMIYLHQCHPPIIHRDLKSSNLLVDKNWMVKNRLVILVSPESNVNLI